MPTEPAAVEPAPDAADEPTGSVVAGNDEVTEVVPAGEPADTVVAAGDGAATTDEDTSAADEVEPAPERTLPGPTVASEPTLDVETGPSTDDPDAASAGVEPVDGPVAGQ